MVERIRTLLEARRLTPTQFADAIGTARPIVSHILSGRNKPSLEVVQRILAAMPELSMAWLLNGTGPMQLAPEKLPVGTLPATAPEEPLPTPPFPVPATIPPSLPPPRVPRSAPAPRQAPAAAPIPPARPAPKRFARAPVPAPNRQSTLASPPREPIEQAVSPTEPVPKQSPTPAPEAAVSAALFTGSDKPIRRIVIFYRDGSFTDYQPE